MPEPAYRRVVIKLSGEALSGSEPFGIDRATIESYAAHLVATRALGVTLGVVVGGGNILRGVEISEHGVSRSSGAAMVMLATELHALLPHPAIQRAGAPAHTNSAP